MIVRKTERPHQYQLLRGMAVWLNRTLHARRQIGKYREGKARSRHAKTIYGKELKVTSNLALKPV